MILGFDSRIFRCDFTRGPGDEVEGVQAVVGELIIKQSINHTMPLYKHLIICLDQNNHTMNYQRFMCLSCDF